MLFQQDLDSHCCRICWENFEAVEEESAPLEKEQWWDRENTSGSALLVSSAQLTDLFPQKTPDEFCSASVSRASVGLGPFSELYHAFPRDSFFFLSTLILCMGILFAFMSVHHVPGRLRRSEDPEFPGIGVNGLL